MRLYRARRKADGLQAVTTWQGVRDSAVAPYSSHRLVEVRSLAMHTVIAQRLMKDPAVLKHAKRNLRRWAAQREGAQPHWLAEWGAILKRPVAEIAGLLAEPSERGARLRQSSPFAGVLGDEERERIREAFRA